MRNHDKRIIFMGTPEFAAFILQRLVKEKYNVVCVVTQPDKPVGRKRMIAPTPVKAVALTADIMVLQPVKIGDSYEQLAELKADLIITAAYGQIIPQKILDLPKFLAINVHGSLLPKYRGGAPIHYALLNGDSQTGITIIKMVKKMDAGEMISQCPVAINDTDNLATVYEKLQSAGAELLLVTIEQIYQHNYQLLVQDESLVSYAPTITKNDELLDFTQSVRIVYNKIRAFNPAPISYFMCNNQRIKVYEAQIIANQQQLIPGVVRKVTASGIEIACQDGVINLTKIQVAGKKPLAVHDYVNGQVTLKSGDVCN